MRLKNEYPLKVLFFEVTSKCNAHCDHCGSRCDINSEDGISSELFKKVLLDVKENIGIDSMLNITGGEPLLRKDLFEITGYAKKLGFDWGMVTNGTLINDSVIKKMKETKMSTISISIDGMKETHENFRHLPNSFNTIIKNIIKLKNANFLDDIQVTFIANKKNIYELPSLYRMLNNLNIDSLRISCIDPIGRAKDNISLMLTKDDFDYLFTFINNTNKLNQLPCFWSCSHYFGNTEQKDKLGRQFFCGTGKVVASILSNGDIFACPNVPRLPQLIQGNIKTDKFSEIWKNKFLIYRERPLNESCNKCEYKKYCNGDSFHTWNFEENKPNFCYKILINEKNELQSKYKSYDLYLKTKYRNLEKNLYLSNKKNRPNVIIEPEAYKLFHNFFHIGQKHPFSMYEQQLGLIGFKYNDDYIIKYVFPSVLKNRTRNMGYVDSDTIKQAINETDIVRENFYLSDDKNDYINDLKFLGFAHSHPMDVNFCYSDGDYQFHQDMLNIFDEYIGILINPSENLIVGFFDKDCKQLNIICLTEKSVLP